MGAELHPASPMIEMWAVSASAALCALTVHRDPSAAVPREAALEIDVRDIDGPRRDGVLSAVKAEAAAVAARRKVGVWLEAGDEKPLPLGAHARVYGAT